MYFIVQLYIFIGGLIMNGIVGYLVITLFLVSFIYAFIRQIEETIYVKKIIKSNNLNYKRVLFGNYLCSASYGLFIIFFILNVFVAIGRTSSITSVNTFFPCLIFLTIILVSKYMIIPKE